MLIICNNFVLLTVLGPVPVTEGTHINTPPMSLVLFLAFCFAWVNEAITGKANGKYGEARTWGIRNHDPELESRHSHLLPSQIWSHSFYQNPDSNSAGITNSQSVLHVAHHRGDLRKPGPPLPQQFQPCASLGLSKIRTKLWTSQWVTSWECHSFYQSLGCNSCRLGSDGILFRVTVIVWFSMTHLSSLLHASLRQPGSPTSEVTR